MYKSVGSTIYPKEEFVNKFEEHTLRYKDNFPRRTHQYAGPCTQNKYSSVCPTLRDINRFVTI